MIQLKIKKLKEVKKIINEALSLLDLSFENKRIINHLEMSKKEINNLEKIFNTNNHNKKANK